eukprot:403367801
MLGLSSERKLLHLFEVIRDQESHAETLRQRLCLDANFAPYSAFMRIDRDANERINSQELKDFFLDNREYTISESDAYNLIKFYDLDKDTRLTFQEFQQMLLPCEDNYLREKTSNRAPFRVSRFEKLPFEMEHKLNAVLSHEVNLLKKLSEVKNELIHSYDFSTYAAYKSVDRWNDGAINVDNLRYFFRLNQRYLTDKEAATIIRRVETDGDGKISYYEFSDFLNNQVALYPGKLHDRQPLHAPLQDDYHLRKDLGTPLQENKNKQRAQTTDKKRNPVQFDQIKEEPAEDILEEIKQQNGNDQQQSYATPVKKNLNPLLASDDNNSNMKTAVKTGAKVESPDALLEDDGMSHEFEAYSDEEEAKNDIEQPIGEIKSDDEAQEQVKEESQQEEQPKPSLQATIYEGTRILEEYLRLEKRIEEVKQQLALKYDFNIFDAFKVLDINGTGAITHADMKKALNDIGIYCSDDEITLFIARYDRDEDGVLKFSEFVDSLISADPYHATILNRKTSNPYNYRKPLYRDDVFSFSTRQLFHELLRTTFFVERMLETQRKINQQRCEEGTLNLLYLHEVIDVDQDQALTRFELRRFLADKARIYATENEINLLMNKFDMDRDYKITVEEFVRELTPKLVLEEANEGNGQQEEEVDME